MRNSKEYLKKLANKIILETLEEKADSLMAKLKNAPTSFDYIAEGDVCEQCGGTELFEGQCVECGMKKGDVLEKLQGKQGRLDKNRNGRLDSEDFKMLRKQRNEDECMECGDKTGEFMENEVCECGSSSIYEGQCMECGELMVGKDSEILEFGTGDSDFTAGMYESDLREKWESDVKVKKTGEHAKKSISDIDLRIKALKDLSQSYQEKGERVPKKLKEKMSELYFAKRSKKGWPGKGKVDVDEEMEEGNAFTGKLAHTKKGDKFEIGDKEYTDNSNLEETLYRIFDGDNSALFTENEVIDLIESIVKEEKQKNENNISKGKEPKGLSKYLNVHKESGKENDDYIKSVVKKFTDYLKPGSKGKYEMNSKQFPKGNGQLAKMDKKAYEIDEEGIDYNMEVSGLNIPDYDEIKPKKETIEKQIKGSSENGNNQDWANAENTGVNDKFAEYFENDQLAKWKDESYGRVPSPVYDEQPKKSKKPKKGKTIKEEFDRIKSLMGYNQKTQ